eukprot:m.251292 g.251292  ORF g.251292 m.251292 type:complete len:421 (-) comp17147_c0_seq1:341-1603(-)
MVASTALWGAVAGQVFFGSIADYVGRRRIFIITPILVIVGAILSALAFDSSTFTIYQQLALYRFILGFGVGGEYPLSATYSSEVSDSHGARGRTISFTFAMQGLGNLLATLVMLILLSTACPRDVAWRIGLGFGAVPAAIAFTIRSRSHETKDFVAVKESRVSHWNNMRAACAVYWKEMIGTAGTWLLLDITFYGNGLFTATITTLMGLGTGSRNAALNAVYIALMAIPGYYLSVAFIDHIGRRRLQWIGSAILAVLYFVLGQWFDDLATISALFLILYGLTFLFSNFGPNMTTFLIPAEFYPPEVRATCHGISAASGKIGAAIASYSFSPLKTAFGIRAVLIICAVVAAIGTIWTLLFVPDYKPDDCSGPIVERREQYHRKLAALNHDIVHRPAYNELSILEGLTINSNAADTAITSDV